MDSIEAALAKVRQQKEDYREFPGVFRQRHEATLTLLEALLELHQATKVYDSGGNLAESEARRDRYVDAKAVVDRAIAGYVKGPE